MTKATIWIAYNTDGDIHVDHDCAGDALAGLIDNCGAAEGTRVIEFALELPEIKPIKVEATIPDTDGPVTVTVQG